MTAADADNEMAHFSLGNAYIQAGRHADAAKSFHKVIELSPQMSKAYQLAGLALMESGKHDEAAELLIEGFTLAASRGDLMVRNIIAEQLKAMDREVPELTTEDKAAEEKATADGSFTCSQTGQPGNQLESPPFRGPIGAWIQENISQETWQEWIGQGTKVINELRLDFSRDEDQETYDRHMREYLGITDDLVAELNSAS